MSYQICPQCSERINTQTGFHCGNCDCCAKTSALVRGVVTHPAEVEQAVLDIRTGLGDGERVTLRCNDFDVPEEIKREMERGGWPSVTIGAKVTAWNL